MGAADDANGQRTVRRRLPEPLVNDQFAELLVRAVRVDFFALMARGEPPIDDDDAPFGEVIYVSAELKNQQGAP
ncbi:MAG: hypothetical protein WCE76_22150 [Mycobacterium sp.]